MIQGKTKWIVLIAVFSILLLAGCGADTKTAENPEGTASESDATATTEAQDTEEDGQNPVMNFIGPYVCDRAIIMIEAEGSDNAKVTVNWAGSAWENSEWSMSGPFNQKDRTIEYHDCVKKEVTYDDDGEIKSSEEVYTGGHGFLTFGEDGTLTWQEDQEHVADDMTFEFNPDAE